MTFKKSIYLCLVFFLWADNTLAQGEDVVFVFGIYDFQMPPSSRRLKLIGLVQQDTGLNQIITYSGSNASAGGRLLGICNNHFSRNLVGITYLNRDSSFVSLKNSSELAFNGHLHLWSEKNALGKYVSLTTGHRFSGNSLGGNRYQISFHYSIFDIKEDSAIFDQHHVHLRTDTVTINGSFNFNNSFSDEDRPGIIQNHPDYFWMYFALSENIWMFKIDSTGVSKVVRSDLRGKINQSSVRNLETSINFNHAGNQMVVVEDDGTNVINLYDFNDSTGEVTFNRSVVQRSQLLGYNSCSDQAYVSLPTFSLNDSFLYFGYNIPLFCGNVALREQIFQIDLSKSPGANLRNLFQRNRDLNFSRSMMLYTATDGHVYHLLSVPHTMTINEQNVLNRIENANRGDAARFVHKYYEFPPEYRGLYYFNLVSGNTVNRANMDVFTSCVDSVTAIYYGTPYLDSLKYDWGDGNEQTHLPPNTKNAQKTHHFYDSSGIYTVKQTAYFSNCKSQKTSIDTLQVNLPPKIKNTTWAVDTNCGYFEVILDFEASKTQEVYLHWGDGNSDTVLLGNTLDAYQFTHRYETEDTFDIQMHWKGFHAGGSQPACTKVFDTTIISIFRPQPERDFDFTKNGRSFTQYDSRYYACIEDSIAFKPQNSSVEWMIVPFVNDTIPNLLYSKTLSNTGLNIIHLEFHNEFSCSETVIVPLTVVPPPSFEWQSALSWCETVEEKPLAFSAQTVADDSIIQTKMAINTWSESQQTAAFSSQKTFDEATAYSLTISAETLHGCRADSLVELMVHPLPKTTLSGTEEVCENQEVEIQAHIANVEEATTVFEAFNQRNTHIQSVANPPIWPHQPPVGQHIIQAYTESNQGCRDTAFFNFEVVAKPQISFEHNDYDFCEEAQPITISGTFQSSRNIAITWNVAEGNLIGNTNQDAFSGQWSGLQNGSYPVSVVANIESLNCADTTEAEVYIFAHPEIHFITEPICENETDIGEISWQDATGLERLEYGSGGNIWENIGFSTETSGEIQVVRNLSAGNHTITIRVTNPKGCATEITDQIRVLELPKAQMNLQFYQSEGVEVTYDLRDESVRHSGVIWDIGDGTIYEESPQQRRFHTFADTGRYRVTLTAHREYRCFDSLSQWLEVRPFIQFLLPNAISANADGLNDYLNFDMEFVSSMKLEIFNRWGQKLMKITEKEQLSHTKNLPQGVYFITGYIQDFRLERHPIHQSLTVVR